jgi:hypothetical protein
VLLSELIKHGWRLCDRRGLDSEVIHIVDPRSKLDNPTERQYADRLERQVTRRLSALEEQAAHALRRARRLPVGAERNDLRQLAMGLLWLHRNGMDALVKQRSASPSPAEGAIAPWQPRFMKASQEEITLSSED